MYKIVFTKRALRDLKKLDSNIKKRIGEKLQQYAAAPFNYARKLKHLELGSYKFRIGDYRIIFDIDGDKIVILRLGHRNEIYK